MKQLLFVALAAFIVAGTGCSGGYKKTKTGMLYKIIPGGKGDSLLPGHFVKFNMEVKLNDSVLANTYGRIAAFETIDTGLNARKHDLSEIFPLLKVGDSVVAIQYVDTLASLYGQLPPFLKKGEKIKMYAKILATYKDMQSTQDAYQNEMTAYKEKEGKELEKYIKDKGINAQKTELGTYVEVLNKGEGPLPDSGKYVSVMYRGKLLDGTVFDTNMDTTFHHTDPYPIRIGHGGSIPGFEDGVKQLAKGGKGIVYIPSFLAYGPRASGDKIKPFSNLIFELEVKDITDTLLRKSPPAPAAAE